MSSPVSFPGIDKLRKYSSSGEVDSNILSQVNTDLGEIKSKGIYIFGTGKLGRKIHNFFSKNSIPVLGYIDNNSKLWGKILDGSKISGPEVLRTDSIVYIASETYVNPIDKQLKNQGLSKTISHFQGSVFFKFFQEFPQEAHFQNLTKDLIENKSNYLEIFSSLIDEKSKVVFDNLIHYRISGNLSFIDKIATSSALEYFDNEVIKISEAEVFFDCGGFNGDSAENFVKFTHERYGSVHIFEPDKTLLAKAQERLFKYKNIFFNAFGVYSENTILKFSSTGDSDGVISSAGNIEIETIALDKYMTKEVPTYIKFDIEGVEIEAINGSRYLIKDHIPMLAIASYHYPNHLWEIPKCVLSISANYNLCLRHYSNCIFGTTYYFLPKEFE
ncbi:MAG: FkbM family methyltransferase [Cyclobacteriaceae bacterium]|nr:FkbM family methyltransferase [Cyclobacteriaceae bacterium]